MAHIQSVVHREIIQGHIVELSIDPSSDWASARDHLMSTFEWTEAECDENKVDDMAFFDATVTIYNARGAEAGVNHLGGCVYKTVEEFYTTCRSGYYASMVGEAMQAAGVELTVASRQLLEKQQ